MFVCACIVCCLFVFDLLFCVIVFVCCLSLVTGVVFGGLRLFCCFVFVLCVCLFALFVFFSLLCVLF